MTTPTTDEVVNARIRAGRAIRELSHALVGHHADVGRLDALSAVLEEQAALFDTGDVRVRSSLRPSGDWGPPPGDGEQMFSYDDRPISGQAVPYGLDVDVFRDGDDAVGHVTFRAAHEGAPGRCHGGIVSALFDDVYGFLLAISRQPAFTGTLTVRYERGVPLGVPLRCRVRVDRLEGRKLFMSGELAAAAPDDERVVFSRSTAIFITIPADGYAASGG